MQNPIILFYNGRVLRNHQLKKEDLWIQSEKIIAPQKRADRRIDCKGMIIAPGYIDLQINGSFGIDFASSPEKWREVAKRLPQHGVTSFLATLTSQPLTLYPQLLAQLQPDLSGDGALLLGLHLEGPFLNRDFAGAHDAHHIVAKIDLEAFDLKSVKMCTLAPELSNALEAIKILERQGIRVAAGHSNATFTEMASAHQAGLNIVTHLFNAMRPFHHREPGLIGYALLHPEMWYSLILDGIHVHPEVVRLTWKTNSSKLFLVTDAMAGAGLAAGEYYLGRQKVSVREGKAALPNSNTLAGSMLTMDVAVRNLIHFTDCSVIEALEAASLRPAQLLGIDRRKGSLEVGSDADLVLLDDELQVTACYVSGICEFSEDARDIFE